jgi:hypothetical protein
MTINAGTDFFTVMLSPQRLAIKAVGSRYISSYITK